MAMVGWVGAGMDVVGGMNAGKSQGCWLHVLRYRSTSRARDEDTDDTRSHRLTGVQLWVGSCRNCLVFLVRP